MSDLVQIRKALDTVVGANFFRQDLSDLITWTYMPERPLLNAMGVKRATNTTHQWNEQGLNAPTGSTASYNQGTKPYNKTLAPTQRSNNVARFGRVAQVTDTMQWVWRGAGAYRLQDGEMERLYVEALSLNVEEQSEELLNEVEYVIVQGNHASNSAAIGAEVSQFDGIDLTVRSGSTAGAAGQLVNASTAALTEAMVRTLAQQIRGQKASKVIKPDTLLVSPHDRSIVNQWHPSQYVIGVTQNLVGGFDVTQYNTGFSVVDVVTHDWLVSGVAYLINRKQNVFRADGLPLGTEPLARTGTVVETMITTETTLEVRACATTMGAVYGLSTS